MFNQNQINQMKMNQNPNNFQIPNNNMNMQQMQMNNPLNQQIPNMNMNMPQMQMNNPLNQPIPNNMNINISQMQMNNPLNQPIPNNMNINISQMQMNNPLNQQIPNMNMNIPQMQMNNPLNQPIPNNMNIPQMNMNIMPNQPIPNINMNMPQIPMNIIPNQPIPNINMNMSQMPVNIRQNQQNPINFNFSNNQSEMLSRLKQEFEYCTKDDDLVQIGCSFGLVNNNDIYHWIITMTGPKGSPYEGGLFKIKADFPEDYPNHGPELKFINRIYHLNVNFTNDPGHICINSINSWRLTGKVKDQPFYTMKQALFDIFSLFYKQGVESAYDQNMANLYKNHRDQFDQEARKWTQLYASMASMMVNNNN